MEGLAPPLKCLLEIQLNLSNGESLRTSLLHYGKEVSDEFSNQIKLWLFYYEQGKDFEPLLQKIKSPYRRVLLEVFELGLGGHPILKRLEELEDEISKACQAEIEEHLTRLPFLSLLPLFFLQLPSFLLLMLGPFVTQLLKSLNQ